MRLTTEESRALAFIAGMILLSVLGRWADRPQPLRGDLAAINLDSLEAASAEAVPKPKSKAAPKPMPGAAPGPKGGSAAAAAARGSGTTAPIDINTATAEELDAIPGIGPVLASRIVAYRDSVGRFANVDALRGVKGLGPVMLERVRPYARVP